MSSLVNVVDTELALEIYNKRKAIEKAAKLSRFNELGDEPAGDFTVIRFAKTRNKSYSSDEITYVYAAIKAGGKWHITGKTQAAKRHSWNGLKLFMVSGKNPVDSFEILTPKTIG